MGSGTRLHCRFPNMSCGLLPLPFSITIEAHLNPCPWVLTYALAWSLTPPEMNPWPKWKAAKSMGRPNSAVRRLDSHETPKHQTPPSNGRCLDLHETPKHHLPQSIWAKASGQCIHSHDTPKPGNSIRRQVMGNAWTRTRPQRCPKEMGNAVPRTTPPTPGKAGNTTRHKEMGDT
jgi:hypothetical protein